MRIRRFVVHFTLEAASRVGCRTPFWFIPQRGGVPHALSEPHLFHSKMKGGNPHGVPVPLCFVPKKGDLPHVMSDPFSAHSKMEGVFPYGVSDPFDSFQSAGWFPACIVRSLSWFITQGVVSRMACGSFQNGVGITHWNFESFWFVVQTNGDQ